VIDPFRALLWAFDSQSAMLAKRWGGHMLAARYDRFEIVFDHDENRGGSEDGDAWTLAWSYDHGDHWHFAVEWLQVESDVMNRVVQLGEPAFARESKVEISARYTLGGSL
jgi:hypothetical protein